MLENLTSLKVQKEQRSYQLMMAQDSPLGEVFDVLSQMRSYVLQLINQNVEVNRDSQEVDSDSFQ